MFICKRVDLFLLKPTLFSALFNVLKIRLKQEAISIRNDRMFVWILLHYFHVSKHYEWLKNHNIIFHKLIVKPKFLVKR